MQTLVLDRKSNTDLDFASAHNLQGATWAGCFRVLPDINWVSPHLMTVVLSDVLHSESSCCPSRFAPLWSCCSLNIFTDHPGWGVSVVLSDLTEATVFQKGDDSKTSHSKTWKMWEMIMQLLSLHHGKICWQSSLFNIKVLCLQIVFWQAYLHSQWLLDSRRQTIQACVWTHVLRH